MRDLIVTLIVFGSVPFIFRSPAIGILMWSWLAYMNAHRACWGFARSMPFSLIIALSLLLSLLISKEDKKIPWTRETTMLAIFILWMLITTIFALNPEGAWEQWNKIWKIQLITFLTLMVIKDQRRIYLLVATIAASLGFYGVKGGIFTILTAGSYHVWGPDGTVIGGNNEIGLALIMTIPLIRYLRMHSKPIWLKNGCLAAMILCVVAVLGTQSRGALLGLVAMGTFLVMKGKNRFAYSILAIFGGLTLYMFMPDSWHERMGTIKSYDQDGSAMGRINAWGFAINLAMSRLLGGGFETFDPYLFKIYAPNPDDYHDAHSIYFEILGEHGFIGLAIYLTLALFTWRSAARIAKEANHYPELKPLADLMRMIQVSLVGYAVSGAFLGMAYFDLYYALISIVVMSGYVVRRYATNTDMTENSQATISESTVSTPGRSGSFVRKPIRPG
jgi:probable O-glycosylation ligase (exosortase A-associated)